MIRSTHSMSGAALHADAGELAHHRRVADRAHERARHLEVEAVDLLEPLRVASASASPSPVASARSTASAASRPVS